MNRRQVKDIPEALLELIKQKDETALGMLYDMLGGWIYSLAHSILSNSADAEEVTQEVFHTVWTKADTFDPRRGSARAWIATIARRQAIDRTRSRIYRSRTRESQANPNEQPSVHHDQGDGVRRMETNADADHVSQALMELEEEQRKVVSMAYFDGMSHSEIARALDTPLGTVKSRIRSAMNHLRKKLINDV